jgi:hypothetical protein
MPRKTNSSRIREYFKWWLIKYDCELHGFRASSVIRHEKGEVFKRPVAFNLKSAALEELKHMKANEYHRKFF